MSISVNVVARDNGLGLTRDTRLLAGALEAYGCVVHVTRLGEDDERQRWRLGHGWRAALARGRCIVARWRGQLPYDINIHLEHLWPLQLPLARRNIAIPNPEWFDRNDLHHLGRIDQVWAKTRHAERLFRRHGCEVRWIGFASEDASQAGPPRKRTFFHLAGGSRTKGTGDLIALWRQHPEWPLLTVVRHGESSESGPSVSNVRLVTDYLDLKQLRALQNASLFHLCPSTTEGYGHYLGEAMSTGAVVVTTNAAPMNELVTAQRGLLVAATRVGHQGLATLYRVDSTAMEHAISTCLQMDDAQCAAIGQRGRSWFVDNQARFPHRIGAALDALKTQPLARC